ncbi:alpha/beta hydrolase family protein [Phaeocystidibacter luteus]|uniref:Alpha/beta hydrolase n=1 Tax=Phaeocystidibacter luteus TaxID=911197 RepID=A0A6N6RH27_9FLAO|nr:alpha/beta hydrolase [Phaeocystidibacter luteus]KAB2810395.1 alpha/beta hydrolase [Phaeocystidibacter luteus]
MKLRLLTLLTLLSVSSFSQEKLYEVRYDSVFIATPTDSIFGILVSPIADESQTFPAILCLQGGGHVGLDNYTWEPRYFAEHGYVSLICDKAGVGRSVGSSNFRTQTFVQKGEEYICLLDYMRALPQVDESKVGVHGMSEGGRMAVYLAAIAPEKVSFAMSVSGPIESYMENQLYAIDKLYWYRGYESEIRNRVVRVWRMYYEQAARGEIQQATVDSIRAVEDILTHHIYLPSASTRLPSRPMRADIHFSVEEEIKRVNCPIFFQYGELDLLVDPVVSVELIPESDLFTIVTYDGTDHNMTIEGNVHPDYDQDKLDFLETVYPKE